MCYHTAAYPDHVRTLAWSLCREAHGTSITLFCILMLVASQESELSYIYLGYFYDFLITLVNFSDDVTFLVLILLSV